LGQLFFEVASSQTNLGASASRASGSFDLDKCSFCAADEIGNGIVEDDESISPQLAHTPFNTI